MIVCSISVLWYLWQLFLHVQHSINIKSWGYLSLLEIKNFLLGLFIVEDRFIPPRLTSSHFGWDTRYILDTWINQLNWFTPNAWARPLQKKKANTDISIALVPLTKSIWDVSIGFLIIAENKLYGKHKWYLYLYYLWCFTIFLKRICDHHMWNANIRPENKLYRGLLLTSPPKPTGESMSLLVSREVHTMQLISRFWDSNQYACCW